MALLGGVPDLEPVAEAIRELRRTAGAAPATAALAALAECECWWTSSRRHAAGMAPSPLCRRCGAEAEAEEGGHSEVEPCIEDFRHWALGCPASQTLQRAANPELRAALERARQAAADDTLIVHGFQVVAPLAAAPTDAPRWCAGRIPDDAPAFTGAVCIDGADGRDPPKGAWRGGWAAIAVDAVGQVTWGRYGPLPAARPTALLAELWALRQTLRWAVTPLDRIWVDCAAVMEGLV